MADTSIEWTDAVWNPTVGCSRVSRGCEHCYAERVAHRGMSPQHRGLTVLGKHGPRWTGTIRWVPEKLAEPLKWRKPRRVFVNSMSDLFHDGVTNEQIAAVFGVMAATPQHTYQVLTKRPERAVEWFRWIAAQDLAIGDLGGCTPGLLHANAAALAAEAEHHPDGDAGPLHTKHCADPAGPWPLPNVWLGVSVEDQATADERIPLLLECPAAVRWVSYEPALGPVRFSSWLPTYGEPDEPTETTATSAHLMPRPAIDWIVVGGESGPGARPFDLAWARSTIAQCREAGTRAFFKQAGSNPILGGAPLRLRDRKGGDVSELPTDLHVRVWPDAVR